LQLESAVVEAKTVVRAVARSTFQFARFWLNALAPLNMLSIFATNATFQLEMSWLKIDAPLNALATVITDATFHLLMSALNVGLLANTEAMLVTAAVFHSTMLPYVVAAVVALVTHDATAAAMLPFVMHMAHVTEPTLHARLSVGHTPWNVEPHAL
jgi:hypothetical protein